MYTTEKLDLIAQEKGGHCLDRTLGRSLFLWQCEKGHIWKTRPYQIIKRGRWCPKCLGRNITINDLHVFAGSKGGKCFSSEYRSSRKKIKWQCAKGHVWESSFYRAQRTWCAECNQIERYKNTLKEMCDIAKKRGGACLSKEYRPDKKLKWQCKDGHTWEAHGYKVKSGNWCQVCVGMKKFSIEDLQQIAKNRNGRLISTQYLNTDSRLLWECQQGHRWWARFRDIKHHKSWCPFCAGKKTLSDMHRLAREHKGMCLSDRYINSRTELKWKCKLGHVFWKSPQIVLRGHWCPECSSIFKSEEFCRKIFEKLFGHRFYKKWPQWLKRFDTGRRLQLDGYCDKLKIAFEHNGIQHYKLCDLNKTEENLKDLQYRDNVKKQICKEKGVFLVIIPQLGVRINGMSIHRDNLKKYILNELKKQGYQFKKIYYECIAKNAGTGKCSKNMHGKFCTKHRGQFQAGIIDKKGNKLRSFKNGPIYTECIASDSGIGKCTDKMNGRFCSHHYHYFLKGYIDTYGNKIRDVPKRDRSIYKECVAKDAGTGECSKGIRRGRFCSLHRAQYEYGIIDENGIKIRDLKTPVARLSQDEFINRSQKVHGLKYDYSRVVYQNSSIPVTIICPMHGPFEQKPSVHTKGSGCGLCSGRKTEDNYNKPYGHRLTLKEFVLRARKKHGDKYDYTQVNYVNSVTRVKIICSVHGSFMQLPPNHLKGQECPYCSGRKQSTHFFIQESRKRHGDKYDYSQVNYINSTTKVKIICRNHGLFKQRPINHIKGNGCPRCRYSKFTDRR